MPVLRKRSFLLAWLLIVASFIASPEGAITRVLRNGEPCAFPFEFQGEEFRDCVELFNDAPYCKAENDEWGLCAEGETVAPPPEKKTIPPLLPMVTLSLNSSEGEVEILDPTLVYHGECCKALAELGFQSNLPVIVLDSLEQEITTESKIKAKMCTCGTPGNEYDGPVGIRIRGSSSARNHKKKSFAVETKNDDGDSEDVPLMGLPKDNDWVLYGPEMDKTMGMRNLMAYTLAGSSGRYASHTHFCEVFLITDGKKLDMDHYHGIYMLMEKIKRGKNRVNLKKREGEDLTGGYIFKHDNDNQDRGDTVFQTALSRLLMIMVYPKSVGPNDEDVLWLKSHVDDFEAALISEDFKDPVKGYPPFIDIGSFVDYFLLSEITKNPDAYRGSAFVHKDRGGPLQMGPVWDYNEAFGMCCGFPIEGFLNNGRSSGRSGGSAISPEGWRFNICIEPWRCRVDPLDGLSLWYRRLWQDPTFQNAVQARWTRLRAGAFANDRVKKIIAEAKNGIKDASMRNYKRWQHVLNARSRSKNVDFWEQEVHDLEEWLLKRLGWMDEKLINIPSSSADDPTEVLG